MPARPGRARLGMMLEPLLGSTALYRADVSWNTSSELSDMESCYGPDLEDDDDVLREDEGTLAVCAERRLCTGVPRS